LAILPDTLTSLYIMSKKWCEENKAERPVDKRKGIETDQSLYAQKLRQFGDEEAAKRTQKSVGAVYVARSRVMQRIQAELEQLLTGAVDDERAESEGRDAR
jgi:peptide/nickel transport system substrate-binding protein